MLHGNGNRCWTNERRTPGEEMIEQGTQAVDIDPHAGVSAECLLGRGIAGGSQDLPGAGETGPAGLRGNDPRDPEIFRPAAPVYPLPER